MTSEGQTKQTSQSSPQTIALADQSNAPGPYKNLWVPLVVIPAGIVFAIVAVVVLFGGLTGSEKSMEENLALVVSGGKNERQQALFNLTRQAAENQRARAEGALLPWNMPEGFGREVLNAAEGLAEDEYDKRLVFAVLLSTMGEQRGVEELLALARIDASLDPSGTTRFGALQNLAILAAQGDLAAVAAQPIAVQLAEDEDVGLRLLAAGALGSFGGETSGVALRGLLEDSELQVRATAALALARLDPPDPAALALLEDMTGKEIWEAASEARPGQFRRAKDVQGYRRMATLALGRFGEEGLAFLEGLRDCEDLLVREAALSVLEESRAD